MQPLAALGLHPASGRRLGFSDCERLRDGWVAQPVNTVSSVALVAAAPVLAWWARRHPTVARVPAAALTAGLLTAGMGSVDYHGPQSPLAQWGHDWGVAVPLVAAVHADLTTLVPTTPRVADTALAASLVTLGVVLARHPQSGPPMAAVAAGALGVAEGALWRRGRRPGPRPRSAGLLTAAGAATVVGTAAQVLTRTGRPWCRPDSVLQGHALWHICSAVALTCWAMATLPEQPDEEPA